MNIDLLIPIHNIYHRGHNRVLNFIESLKNQTHKINHIYIVDSSRQIEYRLMKNKLSPYIGDSVTHLRVRYHELNKPKLLNIAVRESDADYIICSDCDYMYSPTLIQNAVKYQDGNSLILKEVNMLPNMKITKSLIKKWQFPKSPLNVFRKLACGAMQFASKEWFVKNPYDERMRLLNGMDVYQVMIAERSNIKIHWLEEGQILHQWHKISGFKFNEDQISKNQNILENIKKL